MKEVYIVAGGPSDLMPNLRIYDNPSVQWVGVDRGVYYLLQHNIIPRIAVGDFDSIPQNEWEKVREFINQIYQYRPEKDETDMELALMWAKEQKPDCIKIFGATGGRLDHFLANVFMITNYQADKLTTIEMIDKYNIISFFKPGKYQVSKDEEKKYISFLPLTPTVEKLTLSGFKYPLIHANVPFGSSLCISNELIKENGTFYFEKGILMMIRSTDLQ